MTPCSFVTRIKYRSLDQSLVCPALFMDTALPTALPRVPVRSCYHWCGMQGTGKTRKLLEHLCCQMKGRMREIIARWDHPIITSLPVLCRGFSVVTTCYNCRVFKFPALFLKFRIVVQDKSLGIGGFFVGCFLGFFLVCMFLFVCFFSLERPRTKEWQNFTRKENSVSFEGNPLNVRK